MFPFPVRLFPREKCTYIPRGNSANTLSRVYDLDGQLSRYTLGNITQQLSYANTGNISAITEIGNATNDQSYRYFDRNLSLSGDGKVLIGQFYGSFSGNINSPYWNTTQPHQNVAWNVDNLIDSALTQPAQDRLIKHLNLPALTQIAIPSSSPLTGVPAGTYFDNSFKSMVVEGRMGDVIEVDLKKFIANLLGRQELLLGNGLTDFTLNIGDKTMYADDNNSGLTQKPFKLVTLSGASIDPYSRKGTDSLIEASFDKTGLMYLAPNLTPANLTTLRSGGRLAQKEVTLHFSFKIKDVDGAWVTKQGRVDVIAKDIAEVNTFFGDRPLENPGYSKFNLQGPVQANNANNDVLDVYRVEQRLAYLGFPAFNLPALPQYENQPDKNNPLNLVDFIVDGKFEGKEESALRAFYAATNLRDTPTTNIDEKNWGLEDGRSPAANTVSASNNNFAWLNAFNAPHWMNIYQSLGIPNNGGTTNFLDGQDRQENYGTSWTRDLLKAWEINKSKLSSGGLNTSKLQINGLSDPGYRFAEHNNRNHSIGMGIDLGVGQWIDKFNQKNVNPQNNPNIDSALAAIAGSGWSVERAKLLSEKLPDIETDGTSENNQERALRDFLALYALTREDSATNNNGTWEELLPANEKVRKALFGDGTKEGGLIAEVIIGGTVAKQNPLANIRKVLDKLSILNTKGQDHHNHFHIVLRTPVLRPIDPPTQNLLAGNSALEQIRAGVSEELHAAAQALVAEMQPYFNLQQGEINMFIMDMPDVPPQYAPVVIAQAVQAQPIAQINSTKVHRTIGVCELIDNPPDSPLTAANVISPIGEAWAYLQTEEHLTPKQLTDDMFNTAKATLLQGAEHGGLKVTPSGSYRYHPTPDYLDTDRATFLVEIGNYKVKVVHHFKMISGGIGGTDGYDPYMQKENCPKGPEWKISLNPDDPNAVSYTFEMPTQLTSAYAGFANIKLDFANLEGSAIGQTTGTSITLDTNAAGHGWFIDSTPWSNEEWLPTANPNEWKAKLGSARSSD